MVIVDDTIEAVYSPTCSKCKHLTVIGPYGERRCKAFPEGIPDGIWLSENGHREPHPGDNGIQFEPRISVK